MLPIVNFRLSSVVKYTDFRDAKCEKTCLRINELCYHAIMNLPEIPIIWELDIKIPGL